VLSNALVCPPASAEVLSLVNAPSRGHSRHRPRTPLSALSRGSITSDPRESLDAPENLAKEGPCQVTFREL